MHDQPLSPRARVIARAAVEVLGEKGAAGLTHRAVDRHAELPEGSTSNYFRTRTALIDAVGCHLTQHDLAGLDEASRRFAAEGQTTARAAAEALVTIIRGWTVKEAVWTAARLELFLIARRDRAVAARLSEGRRVFRDRTAAWLERLSKGAGQHAALVMAVVEGLTANQLLHPAGRMTWAGMTDELQRVLAALMR